MSSDFIIEPTPLVAVFPAVIANNAKACPPRSSAATDSARGEMFHRPLAGIASIHQCSTPDRSADDANAQRNALTLL